MISNFYQCMKHWKTHKLGTFSNDFISILHLLNSKEKLVTRIYLLKKSNTITTKPPKKGGDITLASLQKSAKQ